MIETNQTKFISNIAATCLSSDSIRGDGKSLTLLDRIFGLFTKKHNYEHFNLACRNLQNSLQDSSINTLNAAEKIVVYARFKNIARKIKNEDVQKECNEILDQFQKNYLLPADIESTSRELFEELGSKEKSKYIQKNTKKLCALINYYRKDAAAIGSISKNWHSFFSVNKSSLKDKYSCLHKANEKISKSLLKSTTEILSNETQCSETFLYYPYLLSVVLKKCNIQHELPGFLSDVKTLLNKHSNQKDFVENCLQSIDNALVFLVFSKSINLSELNKRKLIPYGDFFQIFDKYLPSVRDEKLTLDIKLHCANLPCPTERTKFPKLALSKKEQLEILVNELQKKEDDKTNEITEILREYNLSKENIRHLVKHITSGNLSVKNQLALKRAVAKFLNSDIESIPWDNFQEFLDKLSVSNKKEKDISTHLISIKRISKTKSFFENQIRLNENEILIPYWYHATKPHTFIPILTSKVIQVKHNREFKGAWVSSQREKFFGPFVFSFSDNITTGDSDVVIGRQYDKHRWRGIQKDITLENQNLALIGVPTNKDKNEQKKLKEKITELLTKNKYPSIRLFSNDQIDFIQNEVSNILGTPNLPDAWWGKGRAYSQHQEKLQADMQSMEIDLTLFHRKNLDNQSAIGKIVQSMALPFYKKPMPRNPSYQTSSMDVRVELGSQSERTYEEKLKRIENKASPARAHHGTMHCTRVALWTQVLSRAYEKLGRDKIQDPILLATAGAMHDVARETEGTDYWDEESSMALSTLLTRANVEDSKAQRYIQAIREKDPRNGQFTTDEQRIVHDADCLDIIRVIGRFHFNERNLCFYKFDPSKKDFCDQLLNEISLFIALTESFKLRTYLEHNSNDFYGDLVRILFATKRFPLICQLIQEDIQQILSTSTESSKEALKLLQSYTNEPGF